MSKKLVIILLGIGGILLLVGGILVSTTVIKNAAQEENKEKQKETTEEYVPDVDKNEAETLKQQHCLETLCIDTLSVLNDNDAELSIVSGELKNTSEQVAPAGYIKIVFKVGEETFERMLYHEEIQGNGIHPIEWQHTNKELIEAPDYQLVKPTETEIQAEIKEQAELQAKAS